MSKLILMRHGHAFNQQLNVLAGDAEFPLTKHGVEQSILLSKRYGHLLSGVSQIICSSVSRCIETIRPFHEENKHIKLTVSDQLREINVGDAYFEDYGDVINEENMFAFGYMSNEKFSNGEGLRDFISRVRGFLESLDVSGDILLVSHSGLLNVVLHDYYDVSFEFFPFFNIHNCYPYVLERK